jgi:hypothetical protein
MDVQHIGMSALENLYSRVSMQLAFDTRASIIDYRLRGAQTISISTDIFRTCRGDARIENGCGSFAGGIDVTMTKFNRK